VFCIAIFNNAHIWTTQDSCSSLSSFYNPYVSEFVISALLIWLLDGPKLFAQFQSIEIESLRGRQKISFCWHSICPWDRVEVISHSGSYCFAVCWRRMATSPILHLPLIPTTLFDSQVSLTLGILWLSGSQSVGYL